MRKTKSLANTLRIHKALINQGLRDHAFLQCRTFCRRIRKVDYLRHRPFDNNPIDRDLPEHPGINKTAVHEHKPAFHSDACSTERNRRLCRSSLSWLFLKFLLRLCRRGRRAPESRGYHIPSSFLHINMPKSSRRSSQRQIDFIHAA